MPLPILYQLFRPPIELPQEKIYREALRDIRNRIQQVDDDILKLAKREECQEKVNLRS